MASKTKLIINYLPQSMDDKTLQNMFAPYGAIESVRVIRDSKTGYSFGYGFVNYTDEESCHKAISELDGLEISNKKIKVALSRDAAEKDTNLYVTNLPRDITVEQLDEIFGHFGTIVQRSVLVDKFTQMPRGVGFVRFSKTEEAAAAMSALNGKVFDAGSCAMPLQIKVADDHSKQKAAYYIGLQHGQKIYRGRGQVLGGRGQPMGGRGRPMGRGQAMGHGQPMGRGHFVGRGRFQRGPYPMSNPGQFSFYGSN